MAYCIQNTQYIYLLQTREFVEKTENGNIYKIGMTFKQHYKRYNGYPKGSTLLFHRICLNCKKREKELIKLFKKKFKHRKEYGREYFEGDYQKMIKTINQILDNEKENMEEDAEADAEEDAEEDIIEKEKECFIPYYFRRWKKFVEDMRDPPPYIIKTSEEFLSLHPEMEFIITNRKKEEGYVNLKKYGTWNKFSLEQGQEGGEDLEGWIYHNRPDAYKMISPSDELVSSDKMWKMTANYINSKTNQEITYEEFIKLDRKDMEDYKQKNYNWARSKNNKYRFGPADYDIDEIHKDILKKNYVKKKYAV